MRPCRSPSAARSHARCTVLAAALRSLLIFGERVDCGLYSIEDMRPTNELRMVARWKLGTHPTSAVLSEAWYFAKRVTLSLALRSSGDAGRGFGRVGAAAALVAG
jgi:hypothetical protein